MPNLLGKQKHYVVSSSEAGNSSLEQVGGLALELAAYDLQQVPLPPYYSISSAAFDDFIIASGLLDKISTLLQKVSVNTKPEDVRNVSHEIEKSILEATFPNTVLTPIIQAYKSLSGISDKYVRLQPSHVLEESLIPGTEIDREVSHIKGEAHLMYAVKRIWTSLFSPDALIHRAKQNYQGGLSMAVIVMRSPQAESSGKAYSLDPISGEVDFITIEAVLGLMISNTLSAYSDVYKIDANDIKLVEKNVAPQEKMYVRKAKADEQNPYLEVNISPEWRRRQKLDDTFVVQLAQIIAKLKKKLGFDVEVNWAYELGKVQITDVHQYSPLHSLSTHTDLKVPNVVTTPEPVVAEEPQEVPAEKKSTKPELKLRTPKVNISKLANEVNEMVETGEIASPESPTKLVLEVSTMDNELLASVGGFSAAYIDATQLISKKETIPEAVAKDKSKLSDFVESVALDLSIIGKSAGDNPLFYCFSDLHAFEDLNQPDGAARFNKYPEALLAEYLSIKRAYSVYGVRNVDLVLPGLRTTTELTNLKKALSTQGFRRTKSTQLYAEVSWPAFGFQLAELDNDIVDGIVLHLEKYARNLLGSLSVTENINTVLPAIQALFHSAHKKGFKAILRLPKLELDKVQPLIELGWEYIVLTELPSEPEMTKLSELSQLGSGNGKESRPGRKAKELF